MNSQRQIKLMGTTIDIAIFDKLSNNLMDKVELLLYEYNMRFSSNDINSELMQINQKAGIQEVIVHPELFELIELGKYHSLLPFGNFDMTIGPIVKLWKIGFKDARIPKKKEIEKALLLVNANDVILNRNKKSVYLAKKGMEIDLGALAKGYIADKIIDFLKEYNVEGALINLGGNVLVYGNNPKKEKGEWFVGLQDPKKSRHNHLGLIRIKNKSVVTSGNYERVLKIDDKSFHHIFDKKTGYPIDSNMASITIVANSSVLCEVWSSQLFGLPTKTAMTIINSLDDVEGIIVTNNNQVIISNKLQSSFEKL